MKLTKRAEMIRQEGEAVSEILELVRKQIEILEMDYCIFLAEIIEGNLKFSDSPALEKWKSDELPHWEEKLAACAVDIEKYLAVIQENDNTFQPHLFDVKGGVKGCIESNLGYLERRKMEIECEISIKEQIGIVLDKGMARIMLKKLVDCKDMIYRLQWYLNDFDVNFEKDTKELLIKYSISQNALTQAAV